MKVARLIVFMLALMAICQSFGQSALVGSYNSDITLTNANQMAGWLGSGPLTFIDIFDWQASQGAGSAAGFHAASDGQGPTFDIYEGHVNGTGAQFLVGGYDPQSWDSSNGYHLTSGAGNSGFIFNLGTSTMLAQTGNGNPGRAQFQTYNAANYGPIFGGGWDLADYSTDLTSGYLFPYSYGSGVSLVGTTSLTNVTFNSVDVFKIGPPPAGTPEPFTMGLGIAGVGMFLRKRGSARK